MTDDERADAAMVERIADDRRIFQALCTERDRLSRLSRGLLPDVQLDHTERLVRVYADRLADLPGTEYGCPCVVLPSGKVYPCQWHHGEMKAAGRAVDATFRPRPEPEPMPTPRGVFLAGYFQAGCITIRRSAAGTYSIELTEGDR